MQTFYAPPERANRTDLARTVQQIANNPIIDCLMNVANGLFAVLNEQRQILAMNEAFLKFMGIEDSAQVLGMRPGEYVRCVHACDMPGGCGTSQYCSTCGAVIAMLAALDSDVPQERNCAITVERDNKEVDIYLQARCCPLTIGSQRFLLLFLQDVSIQQQRATLSAPSSTTSTTCSAVSWGEASCWLIPTTITVSCTASLCDSPRKWPFNGRCTSR